MEAIPVISDTQIEQLRMCEDPEEPGFVKGLIEIFIQDTAGKIKEMQDFMVQKDLEKIGLMAHSLKGASANVGAGKFSKLCEKLHFAGKNKLGAEVTPLMKELPECFKEAKEALLKIII